MSALLVGGILADSLTSPELCLHLGSFTAVAWSAQRTYQKRRSEWEKMFPKGYRYEDAQAHQGEWPPSQPSVVPANPAQAHTHCGIFQPRKAFRCLQPPLLPDCSCMRDLKQSPAMPSQPTEPGRY